MLLSMGQVLLNFAYWPVQSHFGHKSRSRDDEAKVVDLRDCRGRVEDHAPDLGDRIAVLHRRAENVFFLRHRLAHGAEMKVRIVPSGKL